MTTIHSYTSEYMEDFTDSTCKEMVVNDEEMDCRFKTRSHVTHVINSSQGKDTGVLF